MVHTITVTATFDSESESDEFVEAINSLDEDCMFPNGAEVRRDIDDLPQD